MRTTARTLRQYQADIAAFAGSLERLLSILQHETSLGGNGRWYAPLGDQQEAARRAAEVDLQAGRASMAFDSLGVAIDWKPRGAYAWQTIPVNPASSWKTILDPDPWFEPGGIFTTCTQTFGALDALAAREEEYEGSFAGKTEWITRRFTRPQGFAGGGHGVVSGALVALVVGLLVTFLAFRFGWQQ